ncbi:PREDICTED: alpha-endosulfine-like [Drosophila arizonae]|uniref:Alpha-endosulfine-like n=1 Tax=Drosophila arizonae TaxID=7263 RepID=A0ABM1PSJ6_DROAR|nr:PREDICTED: alpha-endosulfine-like [Drosophila arizonae]
MDQDKQEPKSVELLEEEKLIAKKYPMGLPNAGSVFLQKRLNKGHKYFDSGDYQMAKQNPTQPMQANKVITGSIIPTPETVTKLKCFLIKTSNLAKK